MAATNVRAADQGPALVGVGYLLPPPSGLLLGELFWRAHGV